MYTMIEDHKRIIMHACCVFNLLATLNLKERKKAVMEMKIKNTSKNLTKDIPNHELLTGHDPSLICGNTACWNGPTNASYHPPNVLFVLLRIVKTPQKQHRKTQPVEAQTFTGPVRHYS